MSEDLLKETREAMGRYEFNNQKRFAKIEEDLKRMKADMPELKEAIKHLEAQRDELKNELAKRNFPPPAVERTPSKWKFW
jgi:polyhydroxyalkanoate synthesis regulator phasin